MILFAGSEPRLRGITDQPCTAGVDCEEIVFHFSVFVCAYDAAYIADHLRTEHMEPEFTFTLNLRRFPFTILKSRYTWYMYAVKQRFALGWSGQLVGVQYSTQ
eukprot:scpid101626/ scgid10031/ 